MKRLGLFNEYPDALEGNVLDLQVFNREHGRVHGFVVKNGSNLNPSNKIKSIVEVIFSLPVGGLVPISSFAPENRLSLTFDKSNTNLRYVRGSMDLFNACFSLHFGSKVFQDPETHEDPTALLLRYNVKQKSLETEWKLDAIDDAIEFTYIITHNNSIGESRLQDLLSSDNLQGSDSELYLIDIIKKI